MEILKLKTISELKIHKMVFNIRMDIANKKSVNLNMHFFKMRQRSVEQCQMIFLKILFFLERQR